MRLFSFFLICLSLISFATRAQERVDKLIDIPALEMQRGIQYFALQAQRQVAASNIDVVYNRFKWEIDPSVRFITGEVTMYFKNLTGSQSVLLDMAGSLITDSVKQRNSRLSFTRPVNALSIQLGGQLAAGQLDSVTIFYHGVPFNSGFGSFIMSSHAGIPVSWSLSEPYGSADWWPCNTNLGDKIDSIDVYIIHPGIYSAASNGIRQSVQPYPQDLSKKITHWKHRYPIATYLVCFAVTNYAEFNTSVQVGNVQLPMQTLCYPENLQLFSDNTFKVLNAMQMFSTYFGTYPFINEKYGHVQFGWGGGMEHQTSTFIVTPDDRLMAHELAHQWFGDKLTTNSWRDIWLNEGFATFLAAFYQEEQNPQQKLNIRRGLLDNITSAPNGSVVVDDTTSVNRIFSGRLSYNKGGYLLYMLRYILGDADFFAAMRQYVTDPKLAYNYTTTADLKRNLEAVSGKNLTKFFNEWYSGEGYPSYRLTWQNVGSSTVRLQLGQTSSATATPFFTNPIPVLFKKGNQTKTIRLTPDVNNQDFVEDIGFAPDSAFIDPELWLISKNNVVNHTTLTPSGNGRADIYPNPVTDPLTVFFHDYNVPELSVKIFNAAGQTMYSKKITLYNGAEYLRIANSSWAKGVYTVVIVAGVNKTVQQIIK